MSDNTFRVIHTADLHLESGAAHSIPGPDGMPSRYHDYLAALDYIVDQAIIHEVDAFVFAGDLHKHRQPSPTALVAFKHRLDRLRDAGIPALLVTGNHDRPATAGWATAMAVFHEPPMTWVSDNPTVLYLAPKYGFTTPPEPASNTPGPYFITLPWPARSHALAQEATKGMTRVEADAFIAAQLVKTARGLAAVVAGCSGPRVLVAHQTVSGTVTSMGEESDIFSDPILPANELRTLPLDAIMLGHIHCPQGFREHGLVKMAYSGSPERIDFGEENDEKACVLWGFRDGTVELDFLPVPVRPFRTVDIDVHEDGSWWHDDAHVEDAIVRIRGRCSQEAARRIDRRALVETFLGLGAQKVLPLELDITRVDAVRDARFAQVDGPLTALRVYLENQGMPEGGQEALFDAARHLMAALRK